IASDHRAGPMSGGGAVGDFNNDGYPDLYVLGGGQRADALFINNRDGTFSDRASEWGVAISHRGVGVTVADIDDDGDHDLYLTSFGPTDAFESPGRHYLLINQGERFVNMAERFGVHMSSEQYADGYGAAFGDYDLDGDLDLFVSGWHGVDARGSRLFRHAQPGRYVDATTEAGVIDASTHAFGAVWADMDNDRYPELVVAGDFGTSRYYRNNQDGTFAELDPGTGALTTPGLHNWTIGKAWNAMGITAGDFDRDGRIDFFVTAIWPTFNFADPFWGNGLYLNLGDHRFAENGASAGVADGGWGWGTSAVDLDNDGWLDLPMTNGWPHTDTVTGAVFGGEQSYLFRNTGGAVFEEQALAAGFEHHGQGRALLHLDYDRDGDMDLVVLSNKEPARLYRNELIGDMTPADGRWLQVVLDTHNHSGLAPHGAGATISVTTGSGETHQRQVILGGTYLGQSELVSHFGLGRERKILSVVVDWPNGEQTQLERIPSDRRITLAPPVATRSKGKLRPLILPTTRIHAAQPR
ncbi:MAG: CRTAC1 family protein, partial [Gammaproteobacteria bacterium]|nr:CRTAC1 family protein [Gammaproteobacteria bacterium]